MASLGSISPICHVGLPFCTTIFSVAGHSRLPSSPCTFQGREADADG